VPPLALPVAIISPVAPRTATCGPPAGRTTSPGSCSAVPPARPGRRVGAVSVHCTPHCWLASARIVLSPAGSAGGSSPVRRRCSGGGRGRFPARRRWRVLPWRAGRGVRRRGHLQLDASPGRQEQQGQRVVGPIKAALWSFSLPSGVRWCALNGRSWRRAGWRGGRGRLLWQSEVFNGRVEVVPARAADLGTFQRAVGGVHGVPVFHFGGQPAPCAAVLVHIGGAVEEHRVAVQCVLLGCAGTCQRGSGGASPGGCGRSGSAMPATRRHRWRTASRLPSLSWRRTAAGVLRRRHSGRFRWCARVGRTRAAHWPGSFAGRWLQRGDEQAVGSGPGSSSPLVVPSRRMHRRGVHHPRPLVAGAALPWPRQAADQPGVCRVCPGPRVPHRPREGPPAASRSVGACWLLSLSGTPIPATGSTPPTT